MFTKPAAAIMASVVGSLFLLTTIHPAAADRSVRARSAQPKIGGTIVAPTAKASIGLKQLSNTAKVFMKKGSCGLDCGIHKLAAKGNLNLPVQAWLTCPSGSSVNKLRVKIAGTNKDYAVSGKTTRQSVSKKLNIQPWTAADFEKACQKAFGGSWATPGFPKVNKKTVVTTMSRYATPYGHCSGAKQGISKAVKLTLKVTCEDKSYFSPPK